MSYHRMYAINYFCLSGELEETAADLETSRRKLASLRNQKDVIVGPPTPGPAPGTKSDHYEKGGSEKVSKESKELEVAVDEAKVGISSSRDRACFHTSYTLRSAAERDVIINIQ